MFYTFNQNNSGGNFVYNPVNGISHYVIVEADNLDEAINMAEEIGLYFDGEGDCECCGDRWSSYADESEEPKVYGETIENWKPAISKWIDGAEGFVHYKSGIFKGFGL
jgi:hypothetical protein